MAIPYPQPQKDVILRELSEFVSCRNEYRRDALQLIERVRALMSSTIANSSRGRLQQLRPDFRFSLKESIIGGGFEKRTDVLAPDVDVVFRLNGVTPPNETFPAILLYLEEFLKTATQLSIIPGSIKKTDFSVGFTSYNGIEFDLLPATSITNPDEVYQMMRQNKSNARYYRSSLAEKQKQFMKEQSAFAHSVARLGKLWYKLIYFGQHAAAGGTLIELISVAASMITRDENATESCFRAFWKTLEMVKGIQNLQLAFVRDAGGNWRIGGGQFHGNYVMDPSNPDDNLMDRDRLINAMGKLQQTAQVTLEKLQQWNNGRITLLELFQPQPLNAQSCLVEDGGILPETIYICHTQFERNYVEVDVWNQRVLNLRQLRKVLEVLKIRVHSLLVCDAQERRRVAASRESIPEFVKENIRRWFPNPNVTTNQTMQLSSFDVTMSFALGNGWAIRVSVKWPNDIPN